MHDPGHSVDPEKPCCYGNTGVCQDVQKPGKDKRQNIFNVVFVNSEEKSVTVTDIYTMYQTKILQ